jgi:4-oxalocrotonate tautomerase
MVILITPICLRKGDYIIHELGAPLAICQEAFHAIRSSQCPEGALTQDQKRRMIEKITDVVVEVEGIPAVRNGTTVLISEIPDGGWGSRGQALTLADMKAALGAKA